MDEFCIYSCRRLHVDNVDEIFGRLDENGGHMNPSKCKITRMRIILLGHEVSSNSISPDPREALLLQDQPTSMHSLLSFVYK